MKYTLPASVLLWLILNLFLSIYYLHITKVEYILQNKLLDLILTSNNPKEWTINSGDNIEKQTKAMNQGSEEADLDGNKMSCLVNLQTTLGLMYKVSPIQ